MRNYLGDCHGQSSVLIPTLSSCLPPSSGVLKSSQRFSCVEALEKNEISKLEGKRKMRYNNPIFPTTSDFPSTSRRIGTTMDKWIWRCSQVRKHTSFRAIRQYCFQCKNRSYISVKACPEFSCSLYPYRLGKRPDPAELKIWQERFEVKMVENRASEKGQKIRLKNLKNQGGK